MNDEVSVWDAWSLSESEPPMDTDLDGTDDITIISTDLDSSKGFTVVFSRPLSTGDQFDRVLSAGLSLDYCWGTYNKESFKEHNEYGDGSMKLGLTQAESELEENAVGLTLLWALLALLVL